MTLAAIALPAAVFWIGVTPLHGKFVVAGNSNPGQKCAYLTVDPASRHSSLRKGTCVIFGYRVYWNGRQPWTDVYVGSHLAFRYQDASNTRPMSATSGDALWIYDVATERGPILRRWSRATGTLQQEIRFPVPLFRPLMAANNAGAWLMAATNGGEDGSDTVALWHVTSSGVTSVQRGPRAAMWMAVRGRTLWLETVTGTHDFKLWRYDGTRGRLLWTRLHSYLMSPAFGGGSLWSLSGRFCATSVNVDRLDPSTGAIVTVATVPQLDCNQLGPVAYLGGAFWFVNGNELERVPG